MIMSPKAFIAYSMKQQVRQNFCPNTARFAHNGTYIPHISNLNFVSQLD